MQWYTPVATPAALDQLLACSWTAVPTGRHRLVPDACVDVLWISNGDIWVCGPETTAWDFELPQDVVAAGIRFRPGAAAAALGTSAAGLVDVRTPLREVLDGETEDRLRRGIEQAGDLDARRTVLEVFAATLLEQMSDEATRSLEFSDRVLDVLASTPRANAALLAEQLGTTVRQLHRRSQFSFGYGPVMLARILRVQRFVALATTGEPGARTHRLARLAIDAGYSDQAHLARDCRAITGDTPSRFLARYFPTFPDMSDPFKTSESFAVTMSA